MNRDLTVVPPQSTQWIDYNTNIKKRFSINFSIDKEQKITSYGCESCECCECCERLSQKFMHFSYARLGRGWVCDIDF